MKGALSDRAVAAAFYLANLPWLPKIPSELGLPSEPSAPRCQTSDQLFQLLQATGDVPTS